jgi:hypothetical protein
VEYIIFEVKKEDSSKIDEVVKDDIVSRQSITIRDSRSLGIEDVDAIYVKIEGSKEGLKRAEELFKEDGIKKLSTKKAKEINEKIESQDDSAISGMGMIFQ